MSTEIDWLGVAWTVLLVVAFTVVIGGVSVAVFGPGTSTYVGVAIALVVSGQVLWPSLTFGGGSR